MTKINTAREASGGQQQGRDELARRRGIDRHLGATETGRSRHGEWQLVGINCHTELTQPVENGSDRASGRLLVTDESGLANDECGYHREKPHDGTGEAAVNRAGRTRQVRNDLN